MTVHEKIIALLKERRCAFRICVHEAEGRSEAVAKIRGNRPEQALKALVVMAKTGKKDQRYYLAVLPGDQRLDMEALKRYSGAAKAALAPVEQAEALTGCKMGAVPPFSFHPALPVVADPSIRDNEEVVFNAGSLCKSIFMQRDDYIKIAAPAFAPIIAADEP